MALAVFLLLLTCLGEFFTLGTENLGSLPKGSLFGPRDRTMDWNTTKAALAELFEESSSDTLVEKATTLVAKRIAPSWWDANRDPLDMQVPAWENWILWLLGEIRPSWRGHLFYDPMLALERGVGNCGQASVTLTGLLRTLGVDASILSLRGHTMVLAKLEDGGQMVLDPDYGVVFRGSFEEYASDRRRLKGIYQEALVAMGSRESKRGTQLSIVLDALDRAGPSLGGPKEFVGVEAVAIERWSYSLRWIIPILMLISSLVTGTFPTRQYWERLKAGGRGRRILWGMGR